MPFVFDAVKRMASHAMNDLSHQAPHMAKLRGMSFADAQAALSPNAHGKDEDKASKAAQDPRDGKKAEATKEPFAPGTELYTPRNGGYHHAGVYVGHDKVVHVHATAAEAARNLIGGKSLVHVTKTSLAEFKDGRPVAHGPHATSVPASTAIAAAEAKVGASWAYDPLNHNCQHFSSKCVTGRADSPEAHAIKAEFYGALHTVGDVGEKVGDGAEQLGHSVAHGAKKGAQSARHAAEHAASDMKRKGKKLGKKLKRFL